MVHRTRFIIPLTSTTEASLVPFSRVSGNVLRHTRWMVSHSLYRDRSEAASQAFSGGSGTSTETESFAMAYDVGGGPAGVAGGVGGCCAGGGVVPALSLAAFLAASCTLSTCPAYLPCVFLSTRSPALSMTLSTLS